MGGRVSKTLSRAFCPRWTELLLKLQGTGLPCGNSSIGVLMPGLGWGSKAVSSSGSLCHLLMSCSLPCSAHFGWVRECPTGAGYGRGQVLWVT